jgi:hypothetical protein
MGFYGVDAQRPPQKASGKDAIEDEEKRRNRNKNFNGVYGWAGKYKKGQGHADYQSHQAFYVAKVLLYHGGTPRQLSLCVG